MLKKTKEQVENMSKSISTALGHLYKVSDTEAKELVSLINEAITAINNTVITYSNDIAVKSQELTGLLGNFTENKEKLQTVLNEYLTAINSIPKTYKVLFIAEMSSRWDALESVYHEFAKDTTFITEIVIAPVTRRRSKDSKVMFAQDYNDYLTPLGIPHTLYEHYNIQNDRPDIVFFCLPYNSDLPNNFHLSMVRRYSSYMVYIPYAAVVHRFEEKHLISESKVMDGAILARDTSDAFIAVGDFMVDDINFVTGKKDKLIPLGSPKVDFLVNKKANNNWVRNPELERRFEGKTVFFLNTHFRQEVTGDEGFYDLLNFITDYFIINEDIALIWRPHPNTFTFIGIQGEKYMKKTEEITKKMGSCPRIIIDMSPNHVSAFLYSHAVISHLSSIISLAVAIDKPTFVLDRYTNEQKEASQLIPSTSLPCYGLKTNEPPNFNLITQFITDIKNNNDTHKEERQRLCKYMFSNTNGTCGRAVYEYVKKEVLERDKQYAK